MSNCDSMLEKFIKFVPSCQSWKGWETIMAVFSDKNHDFLVILNREDSPLGIISARTALQAKREKNACDRPVSAFLSPMTTVSDQLTLSELLPYLEKASTEEKILVVDGEGKLRGQLDTDGIVQVLLKQQQEEQGPENTHLRPLLEFLDQLPFPLMLQTEEGRLLYQNTNWREKICSHNHNCCLFTVEVSQGSEKQWCNVIAEFSPSEKTLATQPKCPLFSLGGKTRENTQTRASGVWQFLTLVIQDRVLGSLQVVLATDITEQKQLCRELAAKNADLVQLNRLKDEFLACITHELKSPLTAIVGLSNLLNEKSIGELNQRQQRYVNQIYQSGRQLMNLVNDLLDLARLETGQLQLHPELVNLKRVCDRAHQEAQQKTPHSETEFTLNIEVGLETIIADEMRLGQMLAHLLSNGRKFSVEDGKMGLEVSQWEGWIAFTVWDTGIGIPEASQHLIFQKFQQLEDPMTRQFSGSGLGLVLTQRLAHAHGGDVSFISEEGKGSEFTLLLPPAPPPKSSLVRSPSRQAVRKLVLIVEAVPKYLNNLNQHLRRLGYQVAIARSGTEALLKARTFQPCTILLNPILPLLSGWDVLTLLKSHPSNSQIPIIVTGTPSEKQAALNNGADAFINLPVDINQLKAALSTCEAPRSLYRRAITILRLHYSERETLPKQDIIAEILNTPLETSTRINYRLLEADDPEQAELLQRIWHPDVLLLTGENIPQHFLKDISAQDTLPNLPIVCLDPETARLAHQVSHLSIYPCFNLLADQSQNTLWSVLRFAAGMNPPLGKTAPHIIVVDGKQLSTNTPSPRRISEWLNAFIQYLATAGYRSSLSHSWQEVYQQLQHHSADLLVLDLEDVEPKPQILDELKQLGEIKNIPMVALASPQQLLKQKTLHQALLQVATRILPGHSQSMQELLTHLEEQLSLNYSQ